MTNASPGVRLAVFVAALVAVFGASFAIGSAGEPIGERPPMEVDRGDHG